MSLMALALLSLAACTPPVDDTPGVFETFDAALIADAGCRFSPVDGGADALLFATYAGNPDHLAVAKFKGETLKLVPKEPQPMDADTFDITYEVIDYLRWQVRASAMDGVGELQLVRDGEPTDRRAAMTGSCEG